MKKRLISICLVMTILIGLCSGLTVSAAIGGECGPNATWSFVNGTLTISGTGDIEPYYRSYPAWWELNPKIRKVVIGQGIERILACAFYECNLLTSISLPSSLKYISECTFDGCVSLKEVYITDLAAWCKTNFYDSPTKYGATLYVKGKPCTDLVFKGIGEIAPRAFMGANIHSVAFSGYRSVKIGCRAFYGCKNLKRFAAGPTVWFSSLEDHGYWYSHAGCCMTEVACELSGCPQLTMIGDGDYKEIYAEAINAKLVPYCDEFADTSKSDWFHKNGAIHHAVDNGLFSGIEEGVFGPTLNMTRAMFVTVLGRLHGQKVNHKVSTVFTDVKKNQYYTGFVKWAYENSIVAGITKTNFGPDANITREQICAMMVRYSSYAKIELKKVNAAITFKDADNISGYARSAVKTCQMGGLVNGEKSGNSYIFRPKGNATRAEVATIIMNFAKTYK